MTEQLSTAQHSVSKGVLLPLGIHQFWEGQSLPGQHEPMILKHQKIQNLIKIIIQAFEPPIPTPTPDPLPWLLSLGAQGLLSYPLTS